MIIFAGVPCTLSNPCLNGGVCIAAEDKKSFTCDCVNGYKGQLCETACKFGVFYDTQNDTKSFSKKIKE